MNKEQRRRETVNPKTMIITVDIAKNSHWVYFRSGSGFESKVFEIKNDYEGFEKLMIKIKQFKNQYNLSKLIFGYESTGPFAEPLIHFLTDKDIKLIQVNPRHVKRTKDISDNSPLKTDKKDPKIIADLIQLGNYLQVINPQKEIANLRRLSGTRERLVNMRTRLYNILHSQVYLIFPELTCAADLKRKSIQWLLKEYSFPSSISKLNFDDFEQNLKKISRGTLKKEKIQSIYQISKTSIGIKEGREAIYLEIKMLIKQIEETNINIQEVESQMKNELEKVSYSKYLLSLPGIAHVSAAILIGEVGGFTNYKNAKQVEKLAGLNLFENSSGRRRGMHFISKRGRSILRKTYYYIALNSIRKNCIFHNDYKKYTAKGKPHYKAIIAIARKLVKLTFALAKKETWFDEDLFFANKKQRSMAA